MVTKNLRRVPRHSRDRRSGFRLIQSILIPSVLGHISLRQRLESHGSEEHNSQDALGKVYSLFLGIRMLGTLPNTLTNEPKVAT
jgi:hypothetical protein